MLSSNIFNPLGEVNCLFKYWHVVELCLSSRPDSTPRTDFYVFPTEREKKEKNQHIFKVEQIELFKRWQLCARARLR